MQVKLPDLSNQSLNRLTVCAHFATDEIDLSGISEVLCKTEREIPGGNALLVVQRNSDDSLEHLHVDLVREGTVSPPPSSWKELPFDDVVALINESLGRHASGTLRLTIWGRYRLATADLPQDGIIDSLMGVGTESEGALLELDGTSFAIKGARPYTDMRWVLEPPETDDKEEKLHVRVTLVAEQHELPVTDAFLVDSARLMQAGFERFVLEKSVKKHSNDRDKSTTDTDEARRAAEA